MPTKKTPSPTKRTHRINHKKTAKTVVSKMSVHHPLPMSKVGLPFRQVFRGDARDVSKLSDPTKTKPNLLGIPDGCVDLIVTSPPYWKKRDYGFDSQIGQESTPEEFVEQISNAMKSWRRVLKPTASIFLNIGDTYWRKSLQGIPSLIENSARSEGWKLRNRIIWVKKVGCPIRQKIDWQAVTNTFFTLHYQNTIMIFTDTRNATVLINEARTQVMSGSWDQN